MEMGTSDLSPVMDVWKVSHAVSMDGEIVAFHENGHVQEWVIETAESEVDDGKTMACGAIIIRS